MEKEKIIFLPGLNKQLKFLLSNVDIRNKSVLIAGGNTEHIAKRIFKKTNEVFIIVDDEEDLLNMRYNLSGENIPVRLMEFSNTDFINKKFDIIYAQGSITRTDRNKIIKEFKKLLNEDGILCCGEIVSLTNDTPPFVKDLWNQSGLSPLNINSIEDYYKGRGFSIIESLDLSSSLKEFYTLSEEILKENLTILSKEELKQFKKFFTGMEHEIKVYLKLGGNKHIGFKTLLLKNQSK